MPVARLFGLVTLEERRRRGQKSLTNVISGSSTVNGRPASG
jgi:hypothetical protein